MGASVKPTGMENAAAALRYWERRQEVVANNLANVNTDGFKAERTFARLLADGSTTALETAPDMTQGSLTPTGSPLDLALEGPGFFVVETPGGERLTRGGSLSLDPQRQLIDQTGAPVLGDGGGPIVLPANATDISIDRAGRIAADGRIIGMLRIEQVPADIRLQHEGASHLIPPQNRTVMPPDIRNVRQGHRESSNVNSVTALVDMIAVQRAYASAQKALTTLDGIRGTAANELGKV